MTLRNPIELADGTVIPVLYEDRSVLALDKPPGWMLAPKGWINTSRNLQLEIEAGLRAKEFWARSRNLGFLRFVHRLDADTTGVLLMARSMGALKVLSELFKTRQVKKVYLAVVQGVPAKAEWICHLPLAPHPQCAGVMRVDARDGNEAETRFRVVEVKEGRALVEARPMTGRTHQLRVHLAATGCPVLHDTLYGSSGGGSSGRVAGTGEVSSPRRRRLAQPLALRAIQLGYEDPFTRRPVCIEAPTDHFLRMFGFSARKVASA